LVDLNQHCTYNARPLWDGVVTHYCVGAGWSSLVARRAHNPKVVGSNPAPATKYLSIVFVFKRQTILEMVVEVGYDRFYRACSLLGHSFLGRQDISVVTVANRGAPFWGFSLVSYKWAVCPFFFRRVLCLLVIMY
jgi:hypothetical protein